MFTVAILPLLVKRQVAVAITELSNASNIERLELNLLDLLLDAETAQRGFVLTGDERFLAPYHTAVNRIPVVQHALRKEMPGPAETTRLEAIERATAAKMLTVARAIELRRGQGLAPAAAFIAGGTGKAQMDALRTLIGSEIERYAARRADLGERLQSVSNSAANASLVATLTNILVLAGVLTAATRVLRQRDLAEHRANQSAQETQSTNERISRQNTLLFRSADLMHSLELSESSDEAAVVVASYLPQLLPGLSGSLYLYNNSRDLLERKASWGGAAGEPELIEAGDCWALRRGSPHLVTRQSGGLACRHAGAGGEDRLCLPLVTQGDVIGCLSATGAGLSEGKDDQRAWIGQLADQLGLALSNVRLRVSLRQQSVIDPLTQLYNRRYMDEVLRRELARSDRNGEPLSLLVLDLDHFKRINDSYGHEGGDAVLRKVAQVLRDNVRSCDVACRMGGEEMVVLLPNCGIDDALKRADALRRAIAAGDVLHDGRRLHATASIGVAAYPLHARSMQALVHAADLALYQAKHQGRDRVVRAADEADAGATAVPYGS